MIGIKASNKNHSDPKPGRAIDACKADANRTGKVAQPDRDADQQKPKQP
jgi:hypothetical protein